MSEVVIKFSKSVLNDTTTIKNIFEITKDATYIMVDTKNELFFLSRLEKVLKDYNLLYFIAEFPNELFLFGEILNIVLDVKIKINEGYLNYIPIQIMVISNQYKQIILHVIQKLSETYGFSLIHYSLENNVLRIQFNSDSRPIEFICKNGCIETELENLSFTLNKIAFNGHRVIIHRSAIESINSRITELAGHNAYNPVDAYKICLRDYQIKNIKKSLNDLITHPHVQYYLKNRYKQFYILSHGTFSSFQQFIESSFR
jgi:hypothetical protein